MWYCCIPYKQTQLFFDLLKSLNMKILLYFFCHKRHMCTVLMRKTSWVRPFVEWRHLAPGISWVPYSQRRGWEWSRALYLTYCSAGCHRTVTATDLLTCSHIPVPYLHTQSLQVGYLIERYLVHVRDISCHPVFVCFHFLPVRVMKYLH